MIVTPCNVRHPSNTSQISYITVSQELSPEGTYRVPYRLDREVLTLARC